MLGTEHDVVLTLLAANIVGPAAFKFSDYGLPGPLFRAPFYLLRLYIEGKVSETEMNERRAKIVAEPD